METLGQSEPYFVKCIRSNAEKVKLRCSQPQQFFFIPLIAGLFLSLFIILFSSAVASPLFSRPFLSQLPLRFNDNLVLRQLRYTGMLETVRIRQSGYYIKYSYKVKHSWSLTFHLFSC